MQPVYTILSLLTNYFPIAFSFFFNLDRSSKSCIHIIGTEERKRTRKGNITHANFAIWDVSTVTSARMDTLPQALTNIRADADVPEARTSRIPKWESLFLLQFISKEMRNSRPSTSLQLTP